MYLHSEVLAPTTASKFSRHQEVVALSGDGRWSQTGNELWELLPSDNRERLSKIFHQVPVRLNEPICLRHIGTGSLLSTDASVVHHNIFGEEYEVSCHCHQTINKTHNLKNEKLGVITGDTPTRLNMDQKNIWSLSLD